MAKEKEARRPFNLKKEVKLLPGYIILLLWVIFTIALLGWVFGASFSTTAEIFQGKALKFESGLHFENYAKAWNGAGVAGFFGNSLIYSVISCTILILVCAPAAYVLSRFDFIANKFIQTSFVSATGVPAIMVVLPLFSIISGMGILKRPHVLVGMGRPKEYRFESAANIQALGWCLYAGNEKARPDPAPRGLALHSRFAGRAHQGIGTRCVVSGIGSAADAAISAL